MEKYREILTELFLEHYDHLCMLVRNFASDIDYESAVMNVFKNLLEKPPKKKVKNWKNYLFGATINKAIDLGRKKSREYKNKEKYQNEVNILEITPFTGDSNLIMRQLMDTLKKNLSTRDNFILIANHMGYSTKEISDALNITEQALRTALSRAKSKARDIPGLDDFLE